MAIATPYHAGQKQCAACHCWVDPEDYYLVPGLLHARSYLTSDWCRRCRTEAPWEHMLAHEGPSRLKKGRLRAETRGNVSLPPLLWRTQKGKCYYCREPLTEPVLAHKTPITRGGTSHGSNLCLSCQRCSLHKGPLTEDEYFAFLRGPEGRTRNRPSWAQQVT